MFTNLFTPHKKYIRQITKLQISLIVLISLIMFAVVIAFGLFQKMYANAAFSGVNIGDLNVAGKSQDEIMTLLDKRSSAIEKDGLIFTYQGKTVVIAHDQQTAEAGLITELFTFDNKKMAENAMSYGRTGNWFQQWSTRINSFATSVNLPAIYTLDEKKLQEILQANFAQYLTEPREATLVVTRAGSSYRAEIVAEKSGAEFNYADAIKIVHGNLSTFTSNPIALSANTKTPNITKTQATPVLGNIQDVIFKAPFLLAYEDKTWEVSRDDVASWLALTLDDQNPPSVKLTFNKTRLEEYLKKLSQEINVAPTEATFTLDNNRVVEFKENQAGLRLLIDQNINKITDEFFGQINSTSVATTEPITPTKPENSELKITLLIEATEPTTKIGDLNELGIKELIGVGKSNFAGSPTNRIHNIKTGSAAIHGLLIKPGEEFSVVNALGDIDESTGYLKELVIKGKKVVKEYGGGLCQVATTVFRGALDTGLPITERAAHAYNVGYYLENGIPGVDATIYGPHPDLRFLNDTANHILIQTKVEGNVLTYEFWGTKDGRASSRTTPKTYNYKPAPPTEYVETEDLKPGEKKNISGSHEGITASFDYTITYSNGEIKKQTFTSVFKPWPAMWLIGVAPKPVETTTPTTTDPAAPSSIPTSDTPIPLQ